MTKLITSLRFLVTVGVLVVIHEFGHYLVARLMGVKILRFSVGFGKPLWCAAGGRDQTEWVLAAIPLGGYVKMLDEREGEVPSEDAHRAFNRQGVAARIVIVLAGPGGQFPARVPRLLGALHRRPAGREAGGRRSAAQHARRYRGPRQRRHGRGGLR